MPIKVFLICCGLGNIKRGYESFTQECFDVLRDSPELDLTLFKGGGPSSAKQQTLWNLPRYSAASQLLSKAVRKSNYQIEESTFSLSLLPHIQREKPDVIYFSDRGIGHLLWLWRRYKNSHYRLLFSNGGLLGPPFPYWDYTQQVSPTYAQEALEAGQEPERQEVVPYGIAISPDLLLLTPAQKKALRIDLSLPTDRRILLSIGTINTYHKRMDYVIREVASLTAARPYLVILGQREEDTPQVVAAAQQELNESDYTIRTVPHAQVSAYYQAADVFTLASFAEGFGRVFLEALSYGLPCIAHDYPHMRYVLGTHGYFGDLTQPGVMAKLIRDAIAGCQDASARQERHQDCYQRFAWQSLKSDYISLIQRCSGQRS